MSEHIPQGFGELPPDEQRKIRESGRAIGELTFAHTGGLIIGTGPSGAGAFNTGSFFVLEVGGKHWLATADHVVRYYEAVTADDPAVRIQAGELQFDLDDRREVIRDPLADCCLIELASVEAPLTRLPFLSAPAGWPPPRPKEGDFLAVCGYPEFIRRRPAQSEVEFNSLAAVFRVTQAGERHCSCVWERDEFLTFGPVGAPPQGTELGGMSGGPVLLMGGIAFPLVGVVSEFQSTFEILRIGLFQPPAFEPARVLRAAG